MADPTPEQRRQAVSILKDQLAAGGMADEDAEKAAGMMIDQAIAGQDYLPEISLAGDTAAGGQAADPLPVDSAPVPDDPTAVSMFTAHRLDDTLHSLAHATERMTAARAAATGDLRAYHSARVAFHLGQALDNGHRLVANIREHYPAEAAELEQVKQAVGLAKSLTPEVKAATTAHLLETTLHEETHGVRHAQAMLKTDPDDVWEFNADHCSKHLGGAVEHASKLAQHFRDNYPDVARWLDGLDEITAPAEEGGDGKPQHARYAKGGGTVSAQMAAGETISGSAVHL